MLTLPAVNVGVFVRVVYSMGSKNGYWRPLSFWVTRKHSDNVPSRHEALMDVAGKTGKILIGVNQTLGEVTLKRAVTIP
jgi:hypothetical protein